MKGDTICQSIWDKSDQCYGEHVGEHIGKLGSILGTHWKLKGTVMRTHWEPGKNEKKSFTLSLASSPPQNLKGKKARHFDCMLGASHWLHEICLPRVHHHFWPGLIPLAFTLPIQTNECWGLLIRTFEFHENLSYVSCLLIKGLLCINNSNKYSGNTPHQLKQ